MVKIGHLYIYIKAKKPGFFLVTVGNTSLVESELFKSTRYSQTKKSLLEDRQIFTTNENSFLRAVAWIFYAEKCDAYR